MTVFRAFIALFAFLLIDSSASAQLSWNFSYDDTSIGFADPTHGQQRRDTVTAVTNYLDGVLDARGQINFTWEVSSTSGGSTLASAGSYYSFGGNLLVPNTFRQASGNITSGTGGLGQVNFGRNWFATGLSGTGTPGSGQHDLYSVLLHELTHSLGFASGMTSTGAAEFGNGLYLAFDQFLYRGATGNNKLLNEAGNAFVGSPSDLTSNDLYWGGEFGVAANGGNRIKMYAPSSYRNGSSTSHLDEGTYPSLLMSPQIGAQQVVRQFSGFEIGMLMDMGWNNFDWNNTTGNWSEGVSSISGSRWLNMDIHRTDKRVRSPMGTVTSNLVLTFGGNTPYTSTNDVASTFKLNRLILDGTASSPSTIAGTAGSKLEFGFDNGFNVTPMIEQRNTGAFNITSNVSIPQNLIVGGAGSGQVTLAGNITGSGSLTKNGAFTLVVSSNGGNTFSGGTTISGGTLELGASNALPNTGIVNLNGGTLSTGSSTGRSDVVGPLQLSANSTLDLGTGNHSITFSGLTGTPTGTLTITDWTGSPGQSGTNGDIRFTGLTNPNTNNADFLARVQFNGFSLGRATFLNLGGGVYELVPAPVPEPTTILALATGALGLGHYVRRRRKSGVENEATTAC